MRATTSVKTRGARLDRPGLTRDSNLVESGHRLVARIAAQINAGRNPAAVHNASATSARASTTRAFMRAPAPVGSGFRSVVFGPPSLRTASLRLGERCFGATDFARSAI